jgi:hypothetical protein
MANLTEGLNPASFTVHPSCAVGCSVSVLLSWPRLESSPFPKSFIVHPTVDSQAAVMQQVLAQGEHGSRLPVLTESRALQTNISIGTPGGTSGMQFRLCRVGYSSLHVWELLLIG